MEPISFRSGFRPVRSPSALILALVMTLALSGASIGQAGDRIPVSSLDDLPRHAYAVQGSVVELLTSDEAFAAFAATVRADVEADLERYDIKDPATLQGMYLVLQRLDMLDGRFDEALELTRKVRALEDKQALALTGGITVKALVAGHRAASRAEAADREAVLRAAYAEQLSGLVSELPWEVVQEEIEWAKGRTEILSENMVIGMVKSRLDPIVAKTGELSADAARTVIAMRYTLECAMPVREQTLEIYEGFIKEHRIVKADIWAERALTLQAGQDLHEVMVAVWDTGVDTSLFAGRLFINSKEKADGQDTDGNGFVDDVHGIAYDLEGRRSPELLHPLGDMEGRVDGTMSLTKGFMDIQAAVDSPEASRLKQQLGKLPPDDVLPLIEELGFISVYLHGTHVSGIVAEGNPFVRLLPVRITFDYHAVPHPLSVAIASSHARSYHDAVAYMAAHKVRVANMSWGWSLKEVESNLEANGIGATAEERAELTRKIFGILEEGLFKAIESRPEILFVVAAGNEDNDVEFDANIPASFELPNLLTVAAVDQAGDPTSFTSTGENVVVYANGYEVESYVPGGKRVAASGTSMSSPAVTNLAAKLLVHDPELSATRLVELIVQGADRSKEHEGMLLMNQKRSLDLLLEAKD